MPLKFAEATPFLVNAADVLSSAGSQGCEAVIGAQG
jgi:hypothetical protein